MQTTTKTAQETKALAGRFIEETCAHPGETACVVKLKGELGSGKTTFVQGVGEALGVTDTIISPTFVVERVYDIPDSSFKHLVHIDAYRLGSADELTALHFKERLANPHNIILIEWPENVSEALPHDAHTIIFKDGGETQREVTIL